MAAATRIQKANHGDLYDARIKKQWMQGYGEPEHEFEQFYNMESIETEDMRWSYITGLGLWKLKPIGTNVTYDGIFQGYDTVITPKTYALAFTLEYETWKDDPTGLLGGKLAKSLAQMGRETLEVIAAAPFNTPTSPTAFSTWMSGGDGKALLATDHPIPSGGVWANCPSSHVDLSIAALQAVRSRFKKMVGARGQQWALTPKTLVIPVDSYYLAHEILGSDKLPYTADNTKNVLRGGYDIVEWSRLTDPDCWFVHAGKPSELGGKGIGTVAVWREKPWFDRDNVFDSGDRRYKGQFRIGFGYIDGRGWDGSTGG